MSKQFTLSNIATNMNYVSWDDVTLYFSYQTLIAANIAGTKLRSPETFSSTTSGHMTKMGVKDWPQAGDTHRQFEDIVALNMKQR